MTIAVKKNSEGKFVVSGLDPDEHVTVIALPSLAKCYSGSVKTDTLILAAHGKEGEDGTSYEGVPDGTTELKVTQP